jgi:cobalt-zinc-cadmium efflux system outer membrane protein
MNRNSFGAACAALLLLAFASANHARAQSEPPRSIDLAQALDLAREKSPLFEAASARIAEAQGNLTQASVLLVNNPTLGVAAGPRFLSQPGEGSEVDLEVRLAQRFETGGQRRHRMARAESLAAASRSASRDVERVVLQTVASVFYEVLGADERLRLVNQNAGLATNLYEIARSRVSAGASAPLEENTARIRLAEATRQLVRAETFLRTAKLRLSTSLGLDPAIEVLPLGSLPEAATLPPLAELLAAASENHPRLLTSRARIEAANSEVALSKADAWPDVSLGASYARDERDDVVMGGITLEVPLFNRNQGERARASAASRRARAAARSDSLEIQSQLRQSYAEYDAASRSVAAFDADVVRSQRENLRLIESMFQAGKIRFVDVVLLQRELIDGRLGYLAARLDLARAEIETRAAAGLALSEPVIGRTQP